MMELHNPFALTGKTILVTGASSGIGRSIAVEAAGIGATVIVTARNEERLKETFEALAGKERGHRMIVADLLDVEQMENMVNSISQLDGLVLCAGKGLTLPLQFATREKFDDIFSGGNCIYGASKAALDSAMKFAAKEFAARKVRVNSICPAMGDTPLIHRGTVSEEQLMEDAKRYPLGRYGRPEDVAYAAVYLLSDASEWVTGMSMVLDGGLSIK